METREKLPIEPEKLLMKPFLNKKNTPKDAVGLFSLQNWI